MARKPRHAVTMLGSGVTVRPQTGPESPLEALRTPKAPKYGNQPVQHAGRRYASKRERARAWELQQLAVLGEIADLAYQVRYRFVVAGVLVGWYTADFVSVEVASGATVVEDAKGYRTRDWARTTKLMQACHGITVRLV